MLLYKAFVERLQRELQKYCSEREKVQLAFKEDGYWTISIKKDGKTIAEEIDPCCLYDDAPGSFEVAVDAVLNNLNEKKQQYYREQFKKNDIHAVDDIICYRLIHTENHKEFIESVPNMPFLNLTIVFYAVFSKDTNGQLMYDIDNAHMERWGVTVEDLYRLAKYNTPYLQAATFGNMFNGVQSGMDELEDIVANALHIYNDGSAFYELTTEHKVYGAACMLDNALLNLIACKLKDNLYILADHVDSLIIIKSSDIESLKDYRRSTAFTLYELDDEVYLSEKIYYYDRASDKIEIAEIDTGIDPVVEWKVDD